MKRRAGYILVLTLAVLVGATTSCRQSKRAAAGDVAYYTCTMHPSVKSQDPKGKCPICNMDLVPVMKQAAANTAGDYYTCTMHASVKSKDPKAKCPICGMDLVPVKGKASNSDGTNSPVSPHAHGAMGTTAMPETSEFVVPVERQQMIGVTYARVTKKPVKHSLRAVGFVTYDKQRHWDYVSRVDGYVQKLQIFSRGEIVEENQPLLTIYSPEVLTTQQEYLDALRMLDEAKQTGQKIMVDNASKLLESAKRRLSLWNITDNQVRDLAKNGKAADTVTLFSPFKGVVQNLQVDQGRRVTTGDHLVDIADLSVVWVWAEFYQDEFPLLKKDLTVSITSSAYPDEKLSGKIALIDPFLNESKRTGRVRIDVANPELKLRPEMYVDVELERDLGEGLVIPASAVLPTGKRHLVFVDKGDGKLEPRFIQVERQSGEDYVVKSGLEEGDRIVASGNFLIDAESKVQGAIKTF